VKLLEVRSTYLDNDEQGVFNDVGEIQLEESSILSYVHVVLRPALTLMDCTAVSIPVIWPIHSALVSFLPTLDNGAQYSGSVTLENDNERGRKKVIGHIPRQVGNNDVDAPRLHRLHEFLNNLAFGGHVLV